jgi:hypothetical protein
MEWFRVKLFTGERDKLESTSAQEAESVCKRIQAKMAKEYHVLKRCQKFQIIEKLAHSKVAVYARYSTICHNAYPHIA